MEEKKDIEILPQEPTAKETAEASKLTPDQKRAAGVQRMREMLRETRTKGNPKDFVLATENCKLLDYERAIAVMASLPEKIEPGNHVWSHDKNGILRPVEVLRDDGAQLLVKNEVAEFMLERSEVFPTAIPFRPTLIHKSNLHKLVGDNVAGMFWNRRLRMRVNPR